LEKTKEDKSFQREDPRKLGYSLKKLGYSHKKLGYSHREDYWKIAGDMGRSRED
jgi:hypothetical protein